MELLLSIVIILASILLIFVVFVQNPKGGGISSEFGSSQQLGGVKKANDFIEKATWFLAGTIMITSIVLSIKTREITKDTTDENLGNKTSQKGNK